MNFDTVITALVALLSIFLGILVLISDKKSTSNRLFFAFNISAAIWIFSSLAAKYSTIDTVEPFVSIGFAAASLLVYFFLMFSITFPNNQNLFNKFWHWLAIPPMAFVVLSFMNMVAVATPDSANGFIVSNSTMYIPYAVFLFVYIVISIIKLITNYKRESGITKSQIFYILLGSSLYAFFALIFSLVIPILTEDPNIYKWGIYSVIIFLIFAAYAIVERGFLKTRVILTDAIVTGVIFILLIQALLSDNLQRGLVNFSILIVVSYGGFLIIKSVKKEIEQNKKLQSQANKLEKDKEELIKLDAAKDEFLMMATHELTTPITAIRGKLSMAIEENMAKLNEEQKEYFTPAYDAINRLNHISQELVSAALINQNKLVINPENGNLDQLISGIVEESRKSAEAKGNKIEYIFKFKAENIAFDSKKIKEVITNLIVNAIHFTEKGKIEISVNRTDSDIVISVSDNGKGIPLDSQKTLFDKFSQNGRFDPLNPTEQQGAGLGLFIDKEIIELHHGKIWFESTEGKGSTFYFSLPNILIPEPKTTDNRENSTAVQAEIA